MYCTGFAHFANRHACVTFWTQSCPATGNSKPDSPYQPACVRSVTSGLRSVRLCMASASWCWINGWNVRQKLNLCLLWRHDHTKVTRSPWLPFMISFFIWPWRRSRILKISQTMKMAARATAARARALTGSWLYVSMHQSPSLCNAIQTTWPCLLAIPIFSADVITDPCPNFNAVVVNLRGAASTQMSLYQYRDSHHYKDKTVLRPSYRYDINPMHEKTVLYWNRAQMSCG